jgi:hypothetical protein
MGFHANLWTCQSTVRALLQVCMALQDQHIRPGDSLDQRDRWQNLEARPRLQGNTGGPSEAKREKLHHLARYWTQRLHLVTEQASRPLSCDSIWLLASSVTDK